MNQHQKNYALNRIEGLRNIKLQQAENKFTIKEVKLLDREKYELIKNGKVKLFPFEIIHNNNYRNPDLYPSYDFSKLEKPSSLNDYEFNKISTKVNEISQKAKDQIMLGDCEESLKLINELENIKI